MCGIWAFIGDHAWKYATALAPWLMHRGQEGVGYACVIDGLVRKCEAPIERACICLGHARYSTSGPYNVQLQPIVLKDFALAFNGTISNYKEIAKALKEEGIEASNYDAEVLAIYLKKLIERRGIEGAIEEAMSTLRGGYAVLAYWRGKFMAFRDPLGIRPLAMGFTNDGIVFASETSALSAIGASWVEVEPGSLIIIDELGERELQVMRTSRRAYCAFEYIYFMRPDSYFNGILVYEVRRRLGRALARREFIGDIDVVTPIPESSRIAALEYSRLIGRPIEEILVKNRFLGRNFIRPPGERRAWLLYGIVEGLVEGKSIALIDDSIVRGDTLRHIVRELRALGARAIHARIASPPIRYPCFMGIDFPSRRELIAHGKSVEEVGRELGLDSLIYVSIDDLINAIGTYELCLACFTGVYPFKADLEELERTFSRG